MKEQVRPGQSEAIRSQFAHANERRDYGIYTRSMDAALVAKAQSIFPHFGDIPDGAVIVDAGSGTGALAELAASECRAKVYALDISHELLEQAKLGQTMIDLIFGDASEQHLPDNSVDVKYYSTSGHEIESFGGKGRMAKAMRVTYNELKPGGRVIVRDFAKPTRANPMYMKILSTSGVDTIEEATHDGYLDYSLLSTKALFFRFYEEFAGGNAFDYEIVIVDGQEYIKLDAEWAHEFYLRKDYTANWRQEIKEKYTYWDEREAREVLDEAGYTNVQVIPDPNEYILENRLKGKIELFEKGEDESFKAVDFPSSHMVVVGEKPRVSIPSAQTHEISTAVDYDKLKKSIVYHQESGFVTIGNRSFATRSDCPILGGSKKNVYELEGEPARMLKVVKTEGSLNDHGIFKAMYQAVAREDILDEFHVPHLRILEKDSEGPPYRYYVQEKAPDNSVSAADLIQQGTLSEEDIVQMSTHINVFELGKKWQLDTNPFNWFRTVQADGTTQMVYVDGKVYPYDERWEFSRVGLLQWISPMYVTALQNHSARIPEVAAYNELKENWKSLEGREIVWWKKYLSPHLQPAA